MGAVLAHGTDPYAIRHCNTPDFEWCEKLRNRFSGWLRNHGAASDGILFGCEERDSLSGGVGDGQCALCILFWHRSFGTGHGNAMVRVRETPCKIRSHGVTVEHGDALIAMRE
jgi:hypothetical protein